MASKRAKTKSTKKRPQRATADAFAMLDQSQVQEFKEALNVIDQNRDGFIDKEDLHDMFASLGKNPADEYLDAVMNEAPGPISFTTFLTMFGEKLMAQTQKTSSEMLLLALKKPRAPYRRTARESADHHGRPATDEQVDELHRDAPLTKRELQLHGVTRILTHGAKDKDD